MDKMGHSVRANIFVMKLSRLQVEAEFASLCEYFATPPPPTTTPDSFFQLIANFVRAYASTVKQVESRKERQAKQAQRDAARAALKAKSAARTGSTTGTDKKSKRVPHKRALTGIDMGAIAVQAAATAQSSAAPVDPSKPIPTPADADVPKLPERIRVSSVIEAPPPLVKPPPVDGVEPSVVMKAMRRASMAMGLVARGIEINVYLIEPLHIWWQPRVGITIGAT